MARPCTVCDRDDRLDIDAALLSSMPITAVIAELGLSDCSPSALGRHRRNHLGNLLGSLRASDDLDHSDLLQDLAETLADIQAVRRAALVKGNSHLLLRSADSSAKVIGQLLDRLGADAVETIRSMREGGLLARAVAKATTRNPDIGASVLSELMALGDHASDDLADALRRHIVASATATVPTTAAPGARHDR